MIEIRYAPTEGITLHGTEKRHAPGISRPWRWYRAGGFWFVPRTRDTVQGQHRVEALAADLRRSLAAAGLQDPVSVAFESGELRPAEEREAEKIVRAEGRAEALDDKAGRLDRAAAAEWEKGRKIADVIPMGQPILVGHHSEGRHRRDLAKIHRSSEKSAELRDEADGSRSAANAARGTAERLQDAGAISRRIQRLEADRRKLERDIPEQEGLCTDRERPRKITGSDFDKIAPAGSSGPTTYVDVLECGHRLPYLGTGTDPGPTERPCPACMAESVDGVATTVRRQWVEAARLRLKAAVDETGVLRAKLVQAGGVPGPANFQKGDLIDCQWGQATVLRVNPKSLTVSLANPPGRCEAFREVKISYDQRPRLLGDPKAKEDPCPPRP